MNRAKIMQRTQIIIIAPLCNRIETKFKICFFREKQHSNVRSLHKFSIRANLLLHNFRTIIKQSRCEKIFGIGYFSGKYHQFSEPIQRENVNFSANGIQRLR
jgi:hypothetical protein